MSRNDKRHEFRARQFLSSDLDRDFSHLRTISSLFSWLARVCLLASLLAAPWVFGGVLYAHQQWLYGGVFGALGLWLIALLLQPRDLRSLELIVPTLLIPLGGALLLGAIQISRGLPERLPILEFYDRADSDAAALDNDLGRLGQPLGSELARRPQFSVFPASSRLEIVRLTAGIAAFLAGLGLFRLPRMQCLFCGSLALNGACLAFLGIAQKLSWNGMIYWTVPLTKGGQPFASFVNRNNAAGYLNLCLAGAVGFAAWMFWRPNFAETAGFSRTEFAYARASGRIPGRRMETIWLVVASLCILIVAGIWTSLSRGGALSGAIAGMAVLILIAVHRGARMAMWLAAVVSAACVSMLGWLGLQDGMAERFTDGRISSNARWINWMDAWRAVCDFPILGTGFGTYRYAYQPYQVSPTIGWFYNADNHYLEGLTEGGAVGLVLIVICIALMARAMMILARHEGEMRCGAIVYLAVFALLSQCLHAFFDFGISVPANMLTFATICGIIVGEAARRNVPLRPPITIALPVWRPQLVMVLVTICIVAIGCFGIVETSKAAVGWTARRELPVLNGPDSLNDAKLDIAIKRLEKAAQLRPDDAELRQTLGEAFVFRFRQRLYKERQRQAEENPVYFPRPSWQATGLDDLHRFANAAFRNGQFATIDDLRSHALVEENLQPARRHLLAARATCPVLTKLDLNLAMLAFLAEETPTGISHIRRAAALEPVDEDRLFTAGLLADQAGLGELCDRLWRRVLTLGTQHLSKMMAHFQDKRPLIDLLNHLIPATPGVLLQLARDDFQGEKLATERKLLVQRADELLNSATPELTAAARAYWRGVAATLEGDREGAITHYQEAVRLGPDNIGWRMELVLSFRAVDRLQEAINELKACRQLAPNDVKIESLLRELVRKKMIQREPRRRSDSDSSSETEPKALRP